MSTTTVSHVINETRFVAEETRERVFAAMRDLNYAPSLVARSLKVKETNSIGMLVTTSSNPSSPRWCAGWSATASSRVTT